LCLLNLFFSAFLFPKGHQSVSLRRVRKPGIVDVIAEHLGLEPAEISGVFNSTTGQVVFVEEETIKNQFLIFSVQTNGNAELQKYLKDNYPNFQGKTFIVIGPNIDTVEAKKVVSDSGDLLLIQITPDTLDKLCLSRMMPDAMMALVSIADAIDKAFRNTQDAEG
jgi:hypothetical protein